MLFAGFSSCKIGPKNDDFTVSFITEHGQKPADLSFDDGDVFSEKDLKAPVCDYLVFNGWYLDGNKVKAGDAVPQKHATLVAKWDASISYYCDPEYSDDEFESILVPENSILTSEQLPAVTPKSETTFSGWLIDGITINEQTEYQVKRNQLMVAGWGAAVILKSTKEIEGFTFKDSFYIKNLKIDVGEIIDENYFLDPEDPDFIGWSYNNKLVSESDAIRVNGPVQLDAAWKSTDCVVTFVSEIGNVKGETQIVTKKDTKVEFDVEPEAKGKNFEGWYTDVENPSTKLDDSTVISEDTTYNAKWSNKTYVVTFNSNNGKNQTVTQNFEYSVEQQLTSNTFENSSSKGEKYVLRGWSFVQYNDDETDVVINYKDCETVSIEDDVTLYAVWDQNRVAPPLADVKSGNVKPGTKISLVSETDPTGEDVEIFYSTNGTTPNRNSTRYDYGSSIPLENTGKEQVIKAIAFPIEGSSTEDLNKSFVTTYKYNVVCDVVYNSNLPDSKYSCEELPTEVVPYGTQIQLNKKLESHGLEFLGWADTDNATKPAYTSVNTINVTKDKTLYAVWQFKTYKISYNKGDYGSYIPASKEEKEDYVLTSVDLCKLTSAFAVFNGWKDHLGNEIKPGHILNRNITLIADWTPITYTITYDCGGKTTLAPKTGNLPGSHLLPELLPDLKVDGYYFDGWEYTNDVTDGETTYQQKTVIKPGKKNNVRINKDITLVAQFHKKYNVGDLIYDDVTDTTTSETTNRPIAYIIRAATQDTPALGAGITGVYEGAFMRFTGNQVSNNIYNDLIMKTVAFYIDKKDFTGDDTGADNFADILDYCKNKDSKFTEEDLYKILGPYDYARKYGSRDTYTFKTEAYRAGWFPPSAKEFDEIVKGKKDNKTFLDILSTYNSCSNNLFYGTMSESPYQQPVTHVGTYNMWSYDNRAGWKRFRDDITRKATGLVFFMLREFTE